MSLDTNYIDNSVDYRGFKVDKDMLRIDRATLDEFIERIGMKSDWIFIDNEQPPENEYVLVNHDGWIGISRFSSTVVKPREDVSPDVHLGMSIWIMRMHCMCCGALRRVCALCCAVMCVCAIACECAPERVF